MSRCATEATGSMVQTTKSPTQGSPVTAWDRPQPCGSERYLNRGSFFWMSGMLSSSDMADWDGFILWVTESICASAVISTRTQTRNKRRGIYIAIAHGCFAQSRITRLGHAASFNSSSRRPPVINIDAVMWVSRIDSSVNRCNSLRQ